MSDSYTIRRPWGDKVALLGLFILALLAARLVVTLKSAVLLSEPIELPRSGLSVSMPMGNGWSSEGKWKFQENAFIVRSVLSLTSGKPVAQAHCRYLLAVEPTAHRARLEQRASEVNGAIVRMDQLQAASLTIDWAHIERPEVLLDTFIGTAELPNERELDIEVNQITGDTELAEQIFKAIVNSLDFKDNQLLSAGAEIVESIKRKGLGNFLENQDKQSFYLVKDSTGRVAGFASDVLTDSGNDAAFNIQTASFSYVEGRHTEEQEITFQCTDKFDEFVYRSQARSAAGRSDMQVVLDKSGTMTVMEAGVQPEKNNYRLGPSAIPDVFIDQVLGQMLDSGKKEIIVDVVNAYGKITPTFVSGIEAAKDEPEARNAAYVFKLELLDGRGFYELLYLNEQKQTYRMFLQREDAYIVERTTAEEIVREFPVYAQTVLQNRQMPK